MKVIFLLFSILLFCNLRASNPQFRKTSLLNSFKDFFNEKLKSLEPSKALDYISFLQKEVSSKEKLGVFEGVVKNYLIIEQEAAQQNESIAHYIMKKYLNVATIESGFNNWTCTECEYVVRSLQGIENSTLIEYVEKFLELCCTAFDSQTVCYGYFHEYATELVNNLFKKLLNPIEVCGAIGLCKDSYHVLDFNDYLKDVLADKPNKTTPQPTLKRTYKVLHLADMHIDFEYEEGKNAFCEQPFCCRGENGDPTTPDQGAQYWGTLAVCDIPPRTAEESLKFISENVKPDLILWTGDNISHDMWHQNISNQTRPTIFLTGLIKKYLEGIPFYPIFGNHECFPADQYDIFGNESDWLRNQTGNVWREFLDDRAFTSLRLKGYYSSYNSNYNLRVIVLNTQTCDTVNFFLLRNPTDPNHMLAWMREELYIAENNNQDVYIIGHIPPGDSFCISQWSERYSVLVDRFSHVIRGQFFGHTHNDHFETMHSYLDNSLVGNIFIAPSMTTYSSQNPSFRIFEVDQETNLPVNYNQYRLNLSKVNSNATNATFAYDLAYDILSEYNLTDLSWNSMQKLSNLIQDDVTTRKKFIYNYWAGGPIGQLTNEKLSETYTMRYYYCKTSNPIFANFIDCLGWNFIKDTQEWLFYILHSLDGSYHIFNETRSVRNKILELEA